MQKNNLGPQQLQAKILGQKWEKVNDTVAVDFKECKNADELMKGGMLRAMAKVYDPLGLVSPVMLSAKNLYPLTCEEGNAWDGPLRTEIERLWKQCWRSFPRRLQFLDDHSLSTSDNCRGTTWFRRR